MFRDKKKYHGRGFTETIEESRAIRVSFKRYLRELEEQDTDVDVFEEENDLPEDKSAIAHMLSAFTDDAIDQEMHDDARDMDSVEDGAEFLMDEFRKWMQHRGYTAAQVNKWMDKHDDTIFDFLYNELT